MASQEIKLHQSWLEPLGGEFDQPYMAELKRFLSPRRKPASASSPRARNGSARST